MHVCSMEEPQETLVHADLPLDVMQVRGPALAASELPAGVLRSSSSS